MARHSTRPSSAPEREIPDVEGLRPDLLARRAKIVATAMTMMMEVDYAKIQVKDVADEAGVALGTLYRYFNSKDHLFACALLEWSLGFGRHLQRTEDLPLIKRVKVVYLRAARAFEKVPRCYDALTQIQSSRDPYAEAVFAEFAYRQNQAFAEALAGTPEPIRGDVTLVMDAVLALGLQSRQRGRLSAAGLYRRIDRGAELLFGTELADREGID
jgi:AcrR family transcriptional regulator